MFSPLEYQYGVRILKEDADEFLLELRSGIHSTEIRLPKRFLPEKTNLGDEMVLRFLPKTIAEESETKILKELLKELLE